MRETTEAMRKNTDTFYIDDHLSFSEFLDLILSPKTADEMSIRAHRLFFENRFRDQGIGNKLKQIATERYWLLEKRENEAKI